MDSLTMLSDVRQNIHHHLPQLECHTQENTLGQTFLRISPKLCDENLVFTSAVEMVVTLKNSQEIIFSLISYKREVLEETTFLTTDQDTDSGLHTYILYLQKVLCLTRLVLCKGTKEENVFTNFGKIRKSDLVLCLIDKCVVNSGQLVFRARQCRTVYTSEEVDTDTNLCGECAQFFSVFLTGDEDAAAAVDTADEEGIKTCPFSNCGKTFRRNKPWENHLKSHGKVARNFGHEGEPLSESNTIDTLVSTELNESVLHSEVKCEPDIISEVEEIHPRKRGKLDSLFEISKKPKRYQCTICSNSYLYEKAFHNHVKAHETNPPLSTESDFNCESCNQTFQNETHVNEHMNKEHFNNLSCDKCPMKFTFKKLLEDHRPKDHPKLHCDSCDVSFNSADSLYSHNLEHHETGGDPCHICGKHVKRSSMANHVKMVHQGENMRKHLCNICGNAYKTKTDLDRHYTKHTGENFLNFSYTT